MMEAVSTSETSVNIYQTTWRNILEDSHLHTRRRENLKSHTDFLFILLGLQAVSSINSLSSIMYFVIIGTQCCHSRLAVIEFQPTSARCPITELLRNLF
jgi:hypothetical protein